MAENPTTAVVHELERVRGREELLDGATQLLAGAERMRMASQMDPLTDRELLRAMTVLADAFAELGDAVETTRRRSQGSRLASAEVERRLNELASTVHGARHNATLVARALKGEPTRLMSVAAAAPA
jgi:hypothetical protein